MCALFRLKAPLAVRAHLAPAGSHSGIFLFARKYPIGKFQNNNNKKSLHKLSTTVCYYLSFFGTHRRARHFTENTSKTIPCPAELKRHGLFHSANTGHYFTKNYSNYFSGIPHNSKIVLITHASNFRS